MKCIATISKLGIAALLLGTTVSLAGCGGSSSSSGSQTTSSSVTILKDNGVQASVPSYQIVVSPSGVATYTTGILGHPEQNGSGSGTLSASLTSKFFQDLAAASPLTKLPAFTGGVSSGTRFLTIKYQGQQAELDGTGNAQAQTLADDCTAIAQALGLPASAT